MAMFRKNLFNIIVIVLFTLCSGQDVSSNNSSHSAPSNSTSLFGSLRSKALDAVNSVKNDPASAFIKGASVVAFPLAPGLVNSWAKYLGLSKSTKLTEIGDGGQYPCDQLHDCQTCAETHGCAFCAAQDVWKCIYDDSRGYCPGDDDKYCNSEWDCPDHISWWGVLLICLAILFGLPCVCFLGAFCFCKSKVKKVFKRSQSGDF